MKKITITAAVFVLTTLVCGIIQAEEHRVNDSAELETALLNAEDGDTIVLVGTSPYHLTGETWISKNLAIQSSGTTPREINTAYGNYLVFDHGIGKDVYLKNVEFSGDGGIVLYNAGTVHINGGVSTFAGDTLVYDGYWQLENNAVYGDTNSYLGVDRPGTLSGSGKFVGDVIEIYGTVAPGLFMDKGNPSYQPGTLEFNAPTTFWNGSRYMPTLWADGTSALMDETTPGLIEVKPGATIYLNFRPGDYSSGTQTYTTIPGDFTVSKPGFIDASYSGTTGDITLNGLNTHYFASQGAAGNLQSLVSQLDAMLADPGTSDALWDKLSGMSLAIENGGNFNNLLNSLTGAQRANTIGLSLMTPKELAFRHIGQNAIARYKYGKNLWFQPYYRHHAIHDGEDTVGYDVSQPGFFLGLDRSFTRRSYGGMFTGYSAPKLSSDDYQADTDVFTFGMLGGTRFDNGWDAKTWGVFGFDHIRTNRLAAGSGDFHDGKTDGWSMGIGVEAGRTRTWRMNRFWDLSLRPFVGLDYEQANQYGFTESGDDELAVHYLGGYLHRGLVRTGVSATAGAYAFDLTGRVMYSGLIFGDSAPRSKAVLPSLMPDAFTVSGNDCGRHFVHAGFDASLWLNEKRSRYLATTYEASMGHRLTSHTLTLAFVQRF